jgi:hypothetical protein
VAGHYRRLSAGNVEGTAGRFVGEDQLWVLKQVLEVTSLPFGTSIIIVRDETAAQHNRNLVPPIHVAHVVYLRGEETNFQPLIPQPGKSAAVSLR